MPDFVSCLQRPEAYEADGFSVQSDIALAEMFGKLLSVYL